MIVFSGSFSNADFGSPPAGFDAPPAGMVGRTPTHSIDLTPPSLVTVTVDDPQTEGVAMRFTTYRISCQLNAGGEPSSCRHRFSDFVKLRSELVASGPGVVVPPLPDKNVMNRFSKEFIEKRQKLLQLFLQRVIDHPLASSNSALFGFLSWPEHMRSVVVARCKDVHMPPCPPDDTGDALKDAAKMTAELQTQLAKVRTVLKRLTQRRNDEGMDLLEFSQGVQMLGEHGMNGPLQASMGTFAQGMEQLAGLTKRQAEDDKVSKLLETLKLFKQLSIALQEQFARRSALGKTIEATTKKLMDMQGQSTTLAGKPGKEKKLADLEQAAAELKLKLEQHKEQYALFTQTLHWELERFNKSKNAELSTALMQYVQAHVTFRGKNSEVIQDVARKLSLTVEAAGATVLGHAPAQEHPVSGFGENVPLD